MLLKFLTAPLLLVEGAVFDPGATLFAIVIGLGLSYLVTTASFARYGR